MLRRQPPGSYSTATTHRSIRQRGGYVDQADQEEAPAHRNERLSNTLTPSGEACTAEEIALDLAIQDAERCQNDEPDPHYEQGAGHPGSRFDYDWHVLQDVLFQDKHCEGLLDRPASLCYKDAEDWFSEFGTSPPAAPSADSAADRTRSPAACSVIRNPCQFHVR